MNAQADIPPAATKLFDIEMEQALLGAILVNSTWMDALHELREIDFYDPMHQRLMVAIKAKYDALEPANPVTISHAMLGDEGFKEVGGRSYLVSLARGAPVLPNVKDYARVITDLALRREIEAAVEDAREWLAHGDIPLTDVVGPILTLADTITERSLAAKASVGAGDSAFGALEEVELAAKEGRQTAAPTGLAALDEKIGGLYGGDLVIIAGRPGMGKSSLATTMARAVAQRGRPVEFFSLEMTAKQLSVRLAADLDYDVRGFSGPLSYSRLLKGKASNAEVERAYEAAARLRGLNITIHDRDSLTMQDIASMARARAGRAKAQGVVVIDHLQIIAAGGRYKGNRVQEITEMTGGAKALAKRLGWAVVLLSQMSREAERRGGNERRPTLGDLRESGSIEQDADIVVGMYRPAYYLESSRPARNTPEFATWHADYRLKSHELELIVLKNRNGPTGSVPAWCEMGANVIRDTRGNLSDSGGDIL